MRENGGYRRRHMREKGENIFFYGRRGMRGGTFFSMRGVVRAKKNGYTRVVRKREAKEPFPFFMRGGEHEEATTAKKLP